MRSVRNLCALLLIVVPTLAASCGDATEESYPACTSKNTLRLVGIIDGVAVDITDPNAIGGLTQTDGGEFESRSGVNVDDQTEVFLAWPKGILDGDTGPATGTVRMATGPLSGQTFFAGEGTRVHMPSDDKVGIIQFQLKSLRTDNATGATHEGTLAGCMN